VAVSSPGMRRDDDDGWPGLLLPGPGEPNPWSLASCAVLVALFARWTLGFLRHGMDPRYLMGSFLHLVHLPFHEAGQSLMDLAPYVADARALRLPLLGGRTGAEVEGHDWGALTMLVALGGGGGVLWRQRARLQAP
jgi:hypothetical protein